MSLQRLSVRSVPFGLHVQTVHVNYTLTLLISFQHVMFLKLKKFVFIFFRFWLTQFGPCHI